MTSSTPSRTHLLLALATPAPASPDTRERRATTAHFVRCLNAAGRWAVQGSLDAPLLAWPADDAGAAAAAAERAAKAHGRAVDVITRGDDRGIETHLLAPFTEAFESALAGPAPWSGAKARRLRNEADKLEAFCVIVRAAAAAADDAAALSDISRAAGEALRARFGGGSVTSVFSWLASPAGEQALDSVLAGEVELSGPLALPDIAVAVELAQQAESLRSRH